MFTFTKIVCKTITTIVVLVIVAGWLLAPKQGENMFAPPHATKIEKTHGLIIPTNDPRQY